MKELFDYADEHIREDLRNTCPVYFFATAGFFLFGHLIVSGMRNVPKNESEMIYSEVRKFISNTGYLFKSNWARTISGSEEAVFGWITTNHLYRKFGTDIYDTVGGSFY